MFKYIQENISVLIKELEEKEFIKLPFTTPGQKIKSYGLEIGKLDENLRSLRLSAFYDNNSHIEQMIAKGTQDEIIETVKKPTFMTVLKNCSKTLEYYINL